MERDALFQSLLRRGGESGVVLSVTQAPDSVTIPAADVTRRLWNVMRFSNRFYDVRGSLE